MPILSLSRKTPAITWVCVTSCGRFIYDALRKVFLFFFTGATGTSKD